MTDLNLYYIGGAGGFYLLHQLLLTGDYFCSFGNDFEDWSYDRVRQHTFSIDRQSWKDNEIWPDNQATLSADTDKNKVYLFNNMWGWDNWQKYPGHKMALYTDEKSWLRLTAIKGAALYWDKPREQFFAITRDALRTNAYSRYINTACEQAMPLCVTWQDIITPSGLAAAFAKLGLQCTDRNLEFMELYLQQHDIVLLKRILGPRISEIQQLLNS